jgi:putative aldouronate transport system substrate-binding protein
MKKMKMLTVLSLAGVIALSGCSSSKSGDNSSNPPKESPGATTETAAPEKVTWFSDAGFWNPPSPWSTDPNTVEGAITKKTGLTFDFNIPAQDGGTKLSLMLATSDNLPDIITVSDANLVKKLVDADKVWNLEEFLKKYDPSSELLTNFPQDIKQALVQRDGGWYAFPSHMDSADARKIYPPSGEFYSDAAKYRNNNAVMLNEQLMKEAGISVADIKTEDDLLAALKKVKGKKVNGADVIPLLIGGKGYQGSTLGTLEDHFGAMQVDKDGNYRDMIFAPETKHALDFLFKAAQEGYFDVSQMTLDDGGLKAAALSGRVLCFIGSTTSTSVADANNGLTWVSPGPILSNQNTKPVAGRYLKAGTGWMQTLIAKTATNPERIAKWLDFMTSNEGLLLNYYGFEGKEYNIKDGFVVQTKQGEEESKDYSKSGVFAFWPFHNIAWHDHATAPPTTLNGVDGLMAMQIQTAAGKKSIIYDTTPLSMPSDFIPAGSKMASDQAQIKTYREAQISKIILAKDTDTMNKLYNDMINKLKQLGQSDIDAKINEQFHKQEATFGVTVKGVNS